MSFASIISILLVLVILSLGRVMLTEPHYDKWLYVKFVAGHVFVIIFLGFLLVFNALN